MANSSVEIKTYGKFRGYKGVKQVGYVSDIQNPIKTRISNFVVVKKENRHDKRFLLTLWNGMYDIEILFPANLFEESFTRFDFENRTSIYGAFFFYGNKQDFNNLKNYLQNAQ